MVRAAPAPVAITTAAGTAAIVGLRALRLGQQRKGRRRIGKSPEMAQKLTPIAIRGRHINVLNRFQGIVMFRVNHFAAPRYESSALKLLYFLHK